MLFLLQKDGEHKNEYSIDNFILKNLIDDSHLLHTYKTLTIDDLYIFNYDDEGFFINKELKNKNEFPDEYKDAIPLGNLEFVRAFYKIFFNIDNEYPIEIPEVLRTDEFLKRKYKIVKREDIPKTGKYFIKDVSELKRFSYSGYMDYFYDDSLFEKPKNKYDNHLYLPENHLYQVSEVVEILSEYRVFAMNGELYSITNYDGDPTIFPDIEMIKKAITMWHAQENSPRSFNIDIAVTPYGSMILEAHLISSIGLYNNVFGTNFLYAYKDTKDYILKNNHEISTFSNFETFKRM